ncbi:MAG: thioredoxin family protein [Bacteroidales bacterium]|nr:thioredoxin family protein [Bacteroidales bacterium]
MFYHLILSLVMLLQLTPEIHWKSEVRQAADGTSQLVLTGDLDKGIDHVTGTVTYMPCAGESCYMPVDWDFEEFFEAASESSGAKTAAPQKVKPAAPQQEDYGSLWALILEAILWGFAMLLTPCVFPMVPMTVSFFMKGSENARQGRLKAFFYGLFIVLLYTVPISAIIGVTWFVGGSGVTADIFNWLSTHWLPNLIFFLVFMVFAASFFGAFEITLPSSWTNGADKNSDRKGLGGIFFLALTLVLVSFSCTGPIVGTVLIKSTQGEFWTPMITMLAFSVAFALPFTVLALFPSLLKKLPKRGGWLNSVKVVLGFIEIALGLKFLSTADQTYHWHLLDREVYLAIWIAVFTLLGLYLIGKIRFKHDTPLEYLSVPRLTLSIAVFAFVVYLLPGMWGAPLKALSGYLPPMETQDFVLSDASPSLSMTSGGGVTNDGTITIAHGLQAYDNLPDGLAAAKAAGKPVFLDFTGYGCVNCREMEARVWSDPEVLRRLRDDFVIVALHVDDKTKLPESAWVTNDKGNLLKDVGRVNSYIALHDFGVNAQPNYFLLDENGNRLAGPRPYNLDIQGFIDFLDTAL